MLRFLSYEAPPQICLFCNKLLKISLSQSLLVPYLASLKKIEENLCFLAFQTTKQREFCMKNKIFSKECVFWNVILFVKQKDENLKFLDIVTVLLKGDKKYNIIFAYNIFILVQFDNLKEQNEKICQNLPNFLTRLTTSKFVYGQEQNNHKSWDFYSFWIKKLLINVKNTCLWNIKYLSK